MTSRRHASQQQVILHSSWITYILCPALELDLWLPLRLALLRLVVKFFIQLTNTRLSTSLSESWHEFESNVQLCIPNYCCGFERTAIRYVNLLISEYAHSVWALKLFKCKQPTSSADLEIHFTALQKRFLLIHDYKNFILYCF